MYTPNSKAWIKTATRIVNQTGRRAFAPNELHKLLGAQDDRFVRPALNISFEAFLEILLSNGQLSRVDVKPSSASSAYRVFSRYIWKDATGIDIALSLRKNSYISHGTAARLHKLTNYKPNHIYVNKEQSPKARQESSLTQEAIDRAFKNAPRTTQYVYKHKDDSFFLLNGKHSGNYEVYETSQAGHTIKVTGLDRTLVDIAVRPVYAGGYQEVLRAFRKARMKLSISKIAAILNRLDHLYPYHQVLGFYLEKSGVAASKLDIFKEMGLRFDFYLGNRMQSPRYHPGWRVYYPSGLR